MRLRMCIRCRASISSRSTAPIRAAKNRHQTRQRVMIRRAAAVARRGTQTQGEADDGTYRNQAERRPDRDRAARQASRYPRGVSSRRQSRRQNRTGVGVARASSHYRRASDHQGRPRRFVCRRRGGADGGVGQFFVPIRAELLLVEWGYTLSDLDAMYPEELVTRLAEIGAINQLRKESLEKPD